MNLIDALNWRYAAKRMNGKTVPDEKIATILEATRLAPTSMGLQPFSVLVISNSDLKEKLQPAAFNQPQIVEASHLLVFAAWKDVTPEHVDTYLENIVATRGVAPETLEGFRAMLMGIVTGRSAQEKYEWAARQAYIAFGTAIAAAALEQVDATPMEGFSPEQVDEVLGLKEKNLRSVTILALGYRNTGEDYLANAKKVRRSPELFFEHVA